MTLDPSPNKPISGVKFVRSGENYADIFTKNVDVLTHRSLTDYLNFAASSAESWWGVRMDETFPHFLEKKELEKLD